MLGYDAIIFDVDGVLINTSRSFTAAAVDAVQVATGSTRFAKNEVQSLKSIRGFNNDWHVAIAGAVWIRFTDDMPFDEFAGLVDQANGGLGGLRHVAGAELVSDLEEQLTRLAQEAYGGTTACYRLYGFEPSTIRQLGRWREEVPLLPPERTSTISSIAGIVTGRNAREMELAFQLLRWRLPAGQVACSTIPALDKPNPAQLLSILDHLGSRKAVYAGDSRDDLDLVMNASRQGAEVDFCYIGPATAPWPRVANTFPNVTEMLNSIEVQNECSKTD
ncbi:HAD family hydrolase [Candidatus Neomarinimicrobiota bacterium]